VIYLVLGRRERGKTTLAYSIASRVERRIVLDPRRLVSRHGKMTALAQTSNDLRDQVFALCDGDPDVAEVIYWPTDDDLGEAFADFVRVIKNETSGRRTPIAIVIDEASFYDLDLPAFQWLAKCSFRESVHIIITAHRPQDIPTSIRSIADHWIVFAMTQEHDLKALAQRSPHAATLAPRLSGRAYVHWDDSHAKLTVNRDERSWFVQLSSAPAPIAAIVPAGDDDDFDLR